MWHQSQNNGIFRGQVIGPPLGVSRSQFTYLGKIEVPVFSNVPSNDLAPESSKKRKAESMGQPGNEMSDGVSQSVSENCWLNEFHEHHKFGEISEMNVQVNNQRVFSNQPFPGECSIEAPQPARHQSNSQNSLNTPISEGTFHNTAVQNLNNFYSRMQPPSFHQQWSSTMINSAAMNIPTFHDMQYTEFNKSSQIDASKPPYPGNINMEGAHVGNFPRNDVNSGGIYSVSIRKLSSPRKPSESVRSSEASHLQNEKSDHFVELNGTTHVQDMSKTGSSFKWNRSGQSIESAEAKDISRVRMDSLGSSECSPMNERDQSYEVRASIARDNVASANGRDQSFGDRSIQLIEDKEKSNMGAMTHSEEVPPKNDTEPSWYLNGKRTVVNKLWDGFVQLNSSTTVSAVAFFKSGEKAPEINWSKSIEVKGKVRLEAFEKFIQELPRSRSRGLMVISLCWIVGSSETGLTGMKEVAKAYKQGRRVGYAQPSAGIDLYVCPRSDTIITILAKYGFFKGMAAVEDDQDSLIGCVVWRRKHSSSDSVSTKGETKSSPLSEQPLYTYNTVIQETAADARTQLHTELVGGSIPLDSQKKSAPPGSTGNNHNQISTDAFYPQDNSVNLKPTLSSDSTSRDNHMKAEMKTPHLQSSEQGKYGFNSEIPRPVLLVPLQNINVQSTPAQDDDDDDDDLPEFDFSFACGVSRQPVSKSFSGNNAHVLSAPLKKNVPAEGAKNANGLIPSTIPVASQQSPSLPPTSNTNPPSLPPKEINQGQSPWHGPPLPPCPRPQYLQLPEQHHAVAKAANSTPHHPPKNHLWDDDDDMPEWCPPDFEHGKQPPSVTNARTSVSCAPTPAPNPTSEKLPPGPSWGMPPLPHPMPVCPPVSESLPPGPPWRLPTSPPSMPVRPPLPTQGLPTGYQNLPVRPPQVRPVDLQTHIGARPPSVPAPDSTLRPQANMFDMGPPLLPPHMRPAGWRGWRP